MYQAEIFKNTVNTVAANNEFWDGEVDFAFYAMKREAEKMGAKVTGTTFIFKDGSKASQWGVGVKVVPPQKEMSGCEQAARSIQEMVVADRRFNGPVITEVEKKKSKRGKAFYGFMGMVAASTDFVVEVYSPTWIRVTWQTQVRALPYQERRGRIFGSAEDVKKFLTLAFVAGKPEEALQVPTK